MIITNKSNSIYFWQITCLPKRVRKGRLLPSPIISFQPFETLDLRNFLNDEDLLLIQENESLPGNLYFQDKLKKTRLSGVSSDSPYTSGSDSVLSRMRYTENKNSNIVEEEISSKEVDELEENLGRSNFNFEIPDENSELFEGENLNTEEEPSKEEINEIDGRRPSQSWRRRQLWVWAYHNGLNPENFANKRKVWDQIKEYLDSNDNI